MVASTEIKGMNKEQDYQKEIKELTNELKKYRVMNTNKNNEILSLKDKIRMLQ